MRAEGLGSCSRYAGWVAIWLGALFLWQCGAHLAPVAAKPLPVPTSLVGADEGEDVPVLPHNTQLKKDYHRDNSRARYQRPSHEVKLATTPAEEQPSVSDLVPPRVEAPVEPAASASTSPRIETSAKPAVPAPASPEAIPERDTLAERRAWNLQHGGEPALAPIQRSNPHLDNQTAAVGTGLDKSAVRILLYRGQGPVQINADGDIALDGKAGKGKMVTVYRHGLDKAHSYTSPAGQVKLQGVAYRGTLEFSPDGDNLRVVNIVPIEDYLRGVVPKELLSSEMEAVKAQAILARTYAYTKLRHRQTGDVWDLRNDVGHQVYGGASAEHTVSDNAVRLTAGRVLSYKGNLAEQVLYHSTCGGCTEGNEHVYGSQPVPYLRPVMCGEGVAVTGPKKAGLGLLLGLGFDLQARLDPMSERFKRRSGLKGTWCADSPYSCWEAVWSSEELGQELGRKLGKPSGSVVGMSVEERTQSGRVKRLLVRFANDTSAEIKGEALRETLRYQNGSGAWCSLPSTRFEVVSADKRTVRIRGTGWGHGIGMCQWGAVGMAKRGRSAEDILSHYFAGTSLVSVTEASGGRPTR